MIKFNDTNIFVGYIKQLLKSFSLPKYKVYTKEQEDYHNNYIKHKKEIVLIQKSLDIIEKDLAASEDEEQRKILLADKEALLKYCVTIGLELDSNNKCKAEKNILVSTYRNYKETWEDPTIKYPLHMRYIPYIRNNELQLYTPKIESKTADNNTITYITEYSNDDWKPYHGAFNSTHGKIHKDTDELFISKGYVYNRKLRNGTKNLVIDNNTYDSYTHEYLGDFLRFHRDYYGIDLMPLYNCFSNNTCPHLNVTFKVSETYMAEFKSADTGYKIYMIPIKFFQKYTIAMDCNEAVELCCGLYGQYAYSSLYNEIMEKTYVCYNNMRFDGPELFDVTDKLKPYLEPEHKLELAQHEDDLKLFIKVPANNKSSIVVLEGDFTEYQNPFWSSSFNHEYNTANTLITNKTVINFEYEDKFPQKLITPLHLLKLNTGESYPFADRLLEYLIGNTITPIDQISDNIERAKWAVSKKLKSPAWLQVDGIWDEKLKAQFYNYISNLPNNSKINHDILGYVDKDVENYYSYINKVIKYKNGYKLDTPEKEIRTISSTNIYGEDEWED